MAFIDMTEPEKKPLMIVIDMDGDITANVAIKVYPDTEIGEIKAKFYERVIGKPDTLEFWFKGVRIDDEMIPRDLEMVCDDIIGIMWI